MVKLMVEDEKIISVDFGIYLPPPQVFCAYYRLLAQENLLDNPVQTTKMLQQFLELSNERVEL